MSFTVLSKIGDGTRIKLVGSGRGENYERAHQIVYAADEPREVQAA
jgi:hypothetical protein